VQADPSDWLVALGDALRAARHETGRSQEDVGLEAGVHPNYVGGIERGQRSPSVECIVELANELRVPPPELFVRAGEALAASASRRRGSAPG
jgi:transcriptional regulator with XRE-family HTH domain